MNHKSELQDLRDYYSDYHKDVHGFRPRGYIMRQGTEEEIRAAIATLQKWEDRDMGVDYEPEPEPYDPGLYTSVEDIDPLPPEYEDMYNMPMKESRTVGYNQLRKIIREAIRSVKK